MDGGIKERTEVGIGACEEIQRAGEEREWMDESELLFHIQNP